MSTTAASGATGDAIPRDAQSEHKANLYQKLVANRKDTICFYPLTSWKNAEEVYRLGGKATAILQRSKYVSVAKGGAGKANTLLMLSADLFLTVSSSQSSSAHRDKLVVGESLCKAFDWMMRSKQENAIALVFDGRSRQVRRGIEDMMKDKEADENTILEGCLLHREPTSSCRDIRSQKRKVFGGMVNHEAYSALLPVQRVRFTSQVRVHDAACGESTTNVSSYTNAHVRPLHRLPRLGVKDKEDSTGVAMPTLPEEIIAACGTKGQPLFWQEWKDVDMHMAFYKDFNIERVFDVSVGSRVPVAAVGMLGIGNEGFAMSVGHASWLNNILDKSIFAIIADGEDEEEDDGH